MNGIHGIHGHRQGHAYGVSPAAGETARFARLADRLASDERPEAAPARAALEKLQADLKAGTADHATLEADREALHAALAALRGQDAPEPAREAPVKPEGAPIGWAKTLAAKIQADTSPEAIRLKEVLADLKGDRGRGAAGQAARQADRTALEDALRTYVEKLRTPSRGTLVNTQA